MKRHDERQLDEVRPVKIERDYLPHAEGSVLFTQGNTKLICTATFETRVPVWRRGSGLGWITAEYAMLPRATAVRTKRESSQGRVCGRSHEIQRLIGRSLRSVANLNQLGGENTIWLDCDVISADGSTRAAAVTGSFIALYDCCSKMIKAGKFREMPLTDFIAAVSVGIVNGVPCLDLDYSEDSQADVDMNVIMNGTGNLVELQGTAEKNAFTRAELDQLIDLGELGINRLIELQQSVLLTNR